MRSYYFWCTLAVLIMLSIIVFKVTFWRLDSLTTAFILLLLFSIFKLLGEKFKFFYPPKN